LNPPDFQHRTCLPTLIDRQFLDSEPRHNQHKSSTDELVFDEYSSTNSGRLSFVDRLVLLLTSSGPPPGPAGADKELLTHVRLFRQLLKQLGFDHIKNSDPRVILVFDEAHNLTQLSTEDPSWSQSTELRRALRKLHRYDLFTLFLSTTGHFYQSTVSRVFHASNRIQMDQLFPSHPFWEFDYDVFAKPIGDGTTLLKELVTNAHMVTLGRALWAHAMHPRIVLLLMVRTPGGDLDTSAATKRSNIGSLLSLVTSSLVSSSVRFETV
jgi:hypothetical protein